MTFADRKLSRQLFELGCKSESEKGYRGDDEGDVQAKYYWEVHVNIPAFHSSDFLAPTEQARENCRILFPKGWTAYVAGQWAEVDESYRYQSRTPFVMEKWSHSQHKLLDLPDEKSFWDAIETAVKQKE